MNHIDIIEQNLRNAGYLVDRIDAPTTQHRHQQQIVGTRGPLIIVNVASARFAPFAFARRNKRRASVGHNLRREEVEYADIERLCAFAFDERVRRWLLSSGSGLTIIDLYRAKYEIWRDYAGMNRN